MNTFTIKCKYYITAQSTALSLDNVNNILYLHKIGLILQIPINRPKVLLLFAYRTMMILTISVLDCCRLIIDWQHLCKMFFFFHFCLRPGRAGLQLCRAVMGQAKISQVINKLVRAIKFRPVQSSSVQCGIVTLQPGSCSSHSTTTISHPSL